MRFRIILSFSNEALKLSAGALFFNFRLFPQKKKNIKTPKKDKKTKKEKEHKEKKPSPASELTEDMSLSDFLVFLRKYAGKLGSMFNRHLYININRFYITVGTDNAASTGILYGAVSQSCAYVFEILNQNAKLSRTTGKNVSIKADFGATETKYDIRLTVKIRLIHILRLLLCAFLDLIKIKEKRNNISESKGTVNK